MTYLVAPRNTTAMAKKPNPHDVDQTSANQTEAKAEGEIERMKKLIENDGPPVGMSKSAYVMALLDSAKNLKARALRAEKKATECATLAVAAQEKADAMLN